MPRYRIQDIKTRKNRKQFPSHNLRRMPSTGKKEKSAFFSTSRAKEHKARRQNFPPVHNGDDGGARKPRSSHVGIWGLAGISVIVLVLAVATLFEGATLKITPRTETVPVDAVFTAARDGGERDVPFEVLEIRETATREVPATEVKQVERRAAGQIVIYNDYNQYNQRLIKNTRFETPDGLIYRVYESVVVPGQKVEGGKRVPGSVEVTVYADKPEEKYNIDRTDFTIPGFKGTPRFARFYARSKTKMADGFVGVVKTIGKGERERIEKELREEARRTLLVRAGEEKPDEFVLYDDAIVITYENLPAAEQEDIEQTSVTVAVQTVLRGAMFQKNILSKYLAKKLLSAEDEGAQVALKSPETLIMKIRDKESFDIARDDEFQFTLRGNPTFVWRFDEEKLRANLAGQRKGELKNVLSQFASIVKAEAIVRPFWKRTFPESVKDIKVEKTGL